MKTQHGLVLCYRCYYRCFHKWYCLSSLCLEWFPVMSPYYIFTIHCTPYLIFIICCAAIRLCSVLVVWSSLLAKLLFCLVLRNVNVFVCGIVLWMFLGNHLKEGEPLSQILSARIDKMFKAITETFGDASWWERTVLTLWRWLLDTGLAALESISSWNSTAVR